MVFLDLMSFRRLAFFLGTPGGELLKRGVEMAFYLLIVYMILTEYRQRHRRDYKYLAAGFFALFLRNAFMSIILFTSVFGETPFTRFGIALVFLDQTLETLALLSLCGALLFPVFRKRTVQFQGYVISVMAALSALLLGTYGLVRTSAISIKAGEAFIETLQIAILLIPFFLVKRRAYPNPNFARSMLFGLAIYLIGPVANLVSFLTMGQVDPRVHVLEHPLPFLSMVLLLRAVYLNMVDKAVLYTKLQKSEETLAKEKELNTMKDNFISIVSHELRTPITSMKLYLALLREGRFGKLKGKQSAAMKTVYDESTRMADLVNDLLTIKKMESGKLQLEVAPFSLPEIVDDLYLNIAKSKGLKIVKKISPCSARGDKNRLKQVFINLMNNAIKFSDKGGSITLTCGENAQEWFFSVKDEGPGIPESELPKIFDRFYQVENALTRRNQGIGLGLSIVKQIVELHRGRVDVKSELGKGSEFIVWLPKT